MAAVSAFYGTQDIDFDPAQASFQGHFAELDEFESEDAVAYLEAQLRLSGHETDFHHYPGTGHWFFEEDRPALDVYLGRSWPNRTNNRTNDGPRSSDLRTS